MKPFSSQSFLRRNKNTMPKLVCGFSMIEMLVSISIITFIMSVTLLNYSAFNDRLALTSAGQELAIVIRQAQTYGLTVREVSPGGGKFEFAYGVYFDKDDPMSYYLFTDLNGDKKYDVGSGCGSGPTNTECIQKFTLRNNITISNVCNETNCPPVPSIRMMDVTFLRPNPDANIYFTNNGATIMVGPSLTGKVVLVSSGGRTLTINIESTGQILVGQIM